LLSQKVDILSWFETEIVAKRERDFIYLLGSGWRLYRELQLNVQEANIVISF
jgi:hypothetical protein